MPRTIIFKIVFIAISLTNPALAQNKVSISCMVVDSSTQQPLQGVVMMSSGGFNSETNRYGFVNADVLKGEEITLYFFKPEYRSSVILLRPSADTLISVKLSINWLKEVTVEDRKAGLTFLPGKLTITQEQINKMSMFMGEKDPVRSLQFLPGVQTDNEASLGLHVRGGGADQNLFILDDATIYNVNHMLGFFSVFNPDVVKEISFYRSDFPARYGGRLSSVVDVTTRDGNKNKMAGSVSVSLLSAKLALEGPLFKKRGSWLVAGRRTFMDYYSKYVPLLNGYENYNFYDINVKLNYEINTKSRIYLSIYNGQDIFNSGSGGISGSLKWGNTGGSLRFNRILSKNLFSNTSLVYSKYKFISTNDGFLPNTLLQYESNIQSILGKTDIDYVLTNQYRVKTGVAMEFYDIKPGVLSQTDQSQRVNSKTYTAQLPYFYLENIISPTNRMNMNAGARVSLLKSDTTFVIVEPRLNVSYSLDSFSVIQASATITSQHLHQLSNTGVGLPTELWVPAIKSFPMEQAHSISSSYSRNGIFNVMNISIGGYYRQMKNITGYRPGATFLALSQDPDKSNYPIWEDNATTGKGRSYGAEVLIEKATGKFNGWISYTLSWSKRTFEMINFGEEYYSNYDRRHNLSLVLNYELHRKKPGRKTIFSATWSYASANPITLPVARTIAPPDLLIYNPNHGNGLIQYTSVNSIRLKDFHRLDIAVQFEKTKKKNKTRTWEVGIYNVYNRANPFYYFLSDSGGFTNLPMTLQQASFFSVIPYLSYTLKFK